MAKKQNSEKDEPTNYIDGVPTPNFIGMDKKSVPELKPDGTYTFALNAVTDTMDGKYGIITNEGGTRRCGSLLGVKAREVGSILLNDNRLVKFVVYKESFMYNGESYPPHAALIYQNPDCTTEVILRSECLDILPTDIVTGEYKIHNGCDLIIYFTNKRTKLKSINITKLERYIKLDRNASNVNSAINGSFGWDCGLFNLHPDMNFPEVGLESVTSTGNLPVGSVYVAVRYLDADLTPYSFSGLNGPILITPNPRYISSFMTTGGLIYDRDLNDGKVYANKSINLVVDNIDTRYPFFQVAILYANQGTDTFNDGYITSPYGITTDRERITISDLSAIRGIISMSNEEITNDFEHIYTVNNLSQVQNRLVLANLSVETRDWSAFQKAANNIKTMYYTSSSRKSEIGDCQVPSKSYATKEEWGKMDYTVPEFIYNDKTLMRDEVYSLSIVWIFKNGDTSPAFHIPGRPALSNVAGTSPTGQYSVTSLNLPFDVPITTNVARTRWYFEKEDDFKGVNAGASKLGYYDSYNAPLNGSWDREPYSITSTSKRIHLPPTASTESTFNDLVQNDPRSTDVQSDPGGFYNHSFNDTYIPLDENIYSFYNNSCNGSDTVERWETVNTSIKYDATDTSLESPLQQFKELALGDDDEIEIYSAGLCGYYEAESQYPPVKDCDGNYIFPHTIGDDGRVIMHRIRHHKLPDARKERFFTASFIDGYHVPEFWVAFNQTYTIYPINIYCYDIEVPVGYEDSVQGYHIVLADRAGNKTVIDKGWLNVSDVSYYYKRVDESSLTINLDLSKGRFNRIHPNNVFMYPTSKFYTVDSYISGLANVLVGDLNLEANNTKRLHELGGNYVEFWSPKSSYNTLVNLQGSYYKLENTMIGSKLTVPESEFYVTDRSQDTDDDSDSWEGLYGWRYRSASRITRMHLPRMNYQHTGHYFLLHNIPIVSSEYTLYNSEVIGQDSLIVYGKNHQQSVMMSKLYQEALGDYPNYSRLDYIPQGSIHPPMSYDDYLFAAPGYGIGESMDHSAMMSSKELFDSIRAGFNFPVAISMRRASVQGMASRDAKNDTRSPHVYYAALKSNIRPYEKLESIIYLKYDNRMFKPTRASVFLKGGDTFISEQTLHRTYLRDTNDNDPNTGDDGKIGSTLLVGLVESEINTHFRNRLVGETYRSYPHHNLEEVLKHGINDLFDELVESIKAEYHYNLDYSSNNRTKIYPALADTFDYCSSCSESYPHTYRWSQPITGSESIDYYKKFMSNDFNQIPTDTGVITNVFTRQEQLFIHTTNTLYRINLAAQELETGNDKVSIGTGALGEAIPQAMFDNLPGFGYGGIEYELTGQYCESRYFWVDTKSLKVWEFSDNSPKDVSAKGMSSELERDLVVYLDRQWYRLRKERYPYLNTHDDASVGIMAVYDPEEDRYILTKKDYEFPPELFETLVDSTTVETYEEGSYYFNEDGFFVGVLVDGNVILSPVDFENDANIINRSFTLSYSLDYESWTSYHSYRPNYMSHNNDTFFSSINNPNPLISDMIWEHNRGEYATYYDTKFDFIIEYVDIGSDTYNSRLWENIAYTSNMYIDNKVTKFRRESFLHTCDRVLAYNNTQSSGVMNVVVKNTLSYYDIYNDTQQSLNVSAHRYGNIWKINNLRDYAKDITFDETLLNMETIATKDWNNAEYRSNFMMGNMGYIDLVSNPLYLDYNQDVYGIKKFEDKFLHVRLFFKPEFNFKINFNLKNNLKQTFI